MVQALLFDCFGVVYVEFRDYVRSVCPPAQLQSMNDVFGQIDHGFLGLEEGLRQLAALLNVTPEDLTAKARQSYHRDERVLSLIRRLRSRYTIGLLTNASGAAIRQLFSESEREELFDEVIVSSEVGLVKPQAELFELAATRLNQPTDLCLLIDDLAMNVEGAKAVGMKGVVFHSYAQLVRELQEYAVHA